MKAWVFVEGPADQLGLEALWRQWSQRLRHVRKGIAIIPLDDKHQFLRKFGERAAEKLVANENDLVVGLPDLYPTRPFEADERTRHNDAPTLKALQHRSILNALQNTHGLKRGDAEDHLARRCYPSVFKHDFEMLLLAAKDALRSVIGTPDALGHWRVPVEDQNHERPPKYLIADLFLAKKGRAYRDTKDAPAVLRKVSDLRTILKTPSGTWTCPEFVAMLRWLGERLGDPCCNLD